MGTKSSSHCTLAQKIKDSIFVAKDREQDNHDSDSDSDELEAHENHSMNTKKAMTEELNTKSDFDRPQDTSVLSKSENRRLR